MKLARWLVMLLLLTACLGQLNRLFIGDSDNVVIYINDLLTGLVALVYLGHALVVRRSWRIPWPLVWLAGWLVVGATSLALGSGILGPSELLISAFYWLRLVAYLAFFFVAFDVVQYAKTGLDKRRSTQRWAIGLVVASLLMAIGGFIQLYVLPDLSVLAKYGWDPHIGRLVTAMLDPNYAGTYLSMGVAVCLGILVCVRLRPWVQLGLTGLTAVLVLAILLTYSRSGYLMLAMVLLVVSFLKSRRLLIIGGLIALIAIISVPRIQTRIAGAISPDASASIRIISWQNSWQIAQDNILLGVGFNSYRYAQDRYGIVSLDQSGNAGAGADSSWIFIAATTGMVGLICYVLAYLGIGWQALGIYVKESEPWAKAISLALLASMTALAVASQFNNALFYTWILEYWWVLAGLVLGWSTIKAEADAV